MWVRREETRSEATGDRGEDFVFPWESQELWNVVNKGVSHKEHCVRDAGNSLWGAGVKAWRLAGRPRPQY